VGSMLFQQQQISAFQKVITFLSPFKPLKIKIYLFVAYMRNELLPHRNQECASTRKTNRWM